MKHLLLTTIAAVVLVGCGESQSPELPTAKAPDISLLKAAIDGNVASAKEAIAAGADVNAKVDFVSTPLNYAATYGRKEIVELLIARGVDVNAKSEWGDTPLDWAASVDEEDPPETKTAKREIADFLRKHGGKTGAELKAAGK